MIGILVLSWLLLFLVLAMMFAVNSISLGTFFLLLLAASALFLFLIIKQSQKKKSAAQAQPKPKPAAKAETAVLAATPGLPEPIAFQAEPATFKPAKTSPAPFVPTAPVTEPPVAAAPPATEPAPTNVPASEPHRDAENAAAAAPPCEPEPDITPSPAAAEPVLPPQADITAPVTETEPTAVALPEDEPVSTPPVPEPPTAAPGPEPVSAAGVKTTAPAFKEISAQFARIRTEWYTAQIKALAAPAGKQSGPGVQAEAALKAFQFQTADAYLTQSKSVPVGPEFRDKLFAEIFGDDVETGRTFFNDLKSGDSVQTTARTIAALISAGPETATVLRRFADALPELADRSRLACAKALGDKRTAAKLENKLAATRPNRGGKSK